jgi:TRAP-type C4-dicarboxylate transport system substrate-binding protein
MVDALLSSPLSTAAYQWFAISKYMSDLKFAPLIGGIVISKTTWEKIPKNIRPQLIASAAEIGRKINMETRRADDEAIAIMKQYGLEICEAGEEIYKLWEAIIEEYYDELIESDFGIEAYTMVEGHLEEFRKNESNK